MALIGMAMFGTIAYVPLFVQGVIGTSATSSGVVLTPLMLGAVTTSFLAGQWVSRTGRYRPNALVGPLILAFGMFLLWRMDVHTTNGEAARNMVVAGIGIGSMMQVFVISVQNAVRRAADGLGDGADAVRALDRRDRRRDGDGRDREPGAAAAAARRHGGRRRAPVAAAAARGPRERAAPGVLRGVLRRAHRVGRRVRRREGGAAPQRASRTSPPRSRRSTPSGKLASSMRRRQPATRVRGDA